MGYNSFADITDISSYSLAVVAFQHREITRNSDKISPYSSSRSSKVIDLGVNRKLTCDFLLVIDIWPYLLPFSILTLTTRKWLIFPSRPCLAPRSYNFWMKFTPQKYRIGLGVVKMSWS